MKSIDSVAVADLPSAFKTSYLPGGQDLIFVFKTLLILSIFLGVIAFAPSKEANYSTLTSNNLLLLINQDRGALGLVPLKYSPVLEGAALLKARDILEKNYFAHLSPTGDKPWDFLKKVGFRYSFAGENLARGYTSVYELENDFLKSPTHRENLLSPLFSETGIAIVKNITVQMFAAPAGAIAYE